VATERTCSHERVQVINRLGRRLLTVVYFVGCGAACLVCALLPQDAHDGAFQLFRISAAVAGKFGVAAAFAMLFVYTTELFPTVVRNAALGANSAAARVGGVAAPMVVLLAHSLHAPPLSFVAFGLTSFLAGAPRVPL
jgi:MFS transporter, OCT family, solute carrier family 22 (organic cation transporter), member 4/5